MVALTIGIVTILIHIEELGIARNLTLSLTLLEESIHKFHLVCGMVLVDDLGVDVDIVFGGCAGCDILLML